MDLDVVCGHSERPQSFINCKEALFKAIIQPDISLRCKAGRQTALAYPMYHSGIELGLVSSILNF